MSNLISNLFLSKKFILFFNIIILFLYIISMNSNPPKFIRRLFNNPVLRIFLLMVIIYKYDKDVNLSITLTIIYLLITSKMYMYKMNKMKEKFYNL
jgi:hypothetical protein